MPAVLSATKETEEPSESGTTDPSVTTAPTTKAPGVKDVTKLLVKTGEKAANTAGAALLFFLASGLAVFAARKTKERK